MITVVNNSDRDIYCPISTRYPDTLKIEYHAEIVFQKVCLSS